MPVERVEPPPGYPYPASPTEPARLSPDARLALIMGLLPLGVSVILVLIDYGLMFLFGGGPGQYDPETRGQVDVIRGSIAILARLVLGALAIMYGIRGRAETRNGAMRGRGRATAGLVLGIIYVAGASFDSVVNGLVLLGVI